jgi:hypothetical protein
MGVQGKPAPTGKQCQLRHRDKTRCQAAADGRWNVYGRKRDNPTWLCYMHAIWYGIHNNPRVDA